MNEQSSNPLDRGLKKLANESVDPFHYTRTMAHVRENISRRKPVMIAIRKSLVISGVFAALFLALLLIPASYTVTIGSIATAEFPFTDDADMMAVVGSTKSIEGVMNANMQVEDGRAQLTLVSDKLSSDQLAKDLKNRISEALTGVNGLKVTSEDIKQHRGGNALAAVTGGKITIGNQFDDNMSDDQIKAEIIAQLEARGLIIQTVDVQTSRNADGSQVDRRVEVRAEATEGVKLPEGGMRRVVKRISDGDGEKEIEIIEQAE